MLYSESGCFTEIYQSASVQVKSLICMDKWRARGCFTQLFHAKMRLVTEPHRGPLCNYVIVTLSLPMAGNSDTRSLVRKLATDIAAQGGVPSPTLIRKALGKGSMSTVVDELSKWAKAREPVLAAAPNAPPALPFPPPQTPPAPYPAELVTELLRQLAALGSQMELMAARDRAIEERLEAVSARMDGMQRHMLLQIHEAREHAAKWKDRFTATKHEAEVWRDTLQAQNLRLTEEVAWLKGSRGAPLQERVRPVQAAPGAAQPGPPTVGRYPGHPRAAFGIDDELPE